MADKNKKHAENVKGKWYVDKECIACDHCIQCAPDQFGMLEFEHAYVKIQPATPEEEALCREAMEGCPVEAIGNDSEE